MEGAAARMAQYWHYIRPFAPLWASARVLDVGCGDGWLMHYVSTNGALSVLGIEPADQNRRLAHIRYPDLNVLPGTFEQFNADPATFDVIFAIMSLGHIGDLDDFFEKITTILDAPGHLIAVVPDFDYFRMQRYGYHLEVEDRGKDQYAVAVTRPSGTIADIVRKPEVYAAAAQSHGMQLIAQLPMVPAKRMTEMAPQYAGVQGKPITQLLRFEKP